MKTKYVILLIDDEPSSVETDKQDIEEFLEGYGIKPDVRLISAPEDGSVHQIIQDQLKNPELDLIMVDFNMEGLNGAQLVKMIRGSDHVFLPVIFYSSSPTSEILDATRKEALDGVYVANRRVLMPKFKAVVSSLLVKEHTTKRTRGLLMEGVSEIDATFGEIFKLSWARANDEQKSTLLAYLREIIEKRAQQAQERIGAFPSDLDNFEEHMNLEFLSVSYDTYTRWRIVRKLLTLTGLTPEQCRELKGFAVDQGEGKSLNSLRNIYAHQSREALDRNHSDQTCVTIRRELRNHTENVTFIAKTLSP